MLNRKTTVSPFPNRAIAISLACHVVVFVLLYLFSEAHLFYPERPLKVVWIDLPKGISEEIELNIKKTDDLPRTTIEEQRRKIGEPKEVHLEPDMKSPVVTGKDAIPKKEPPREKQTPQKKISATDRRIAAALAKLDGEKGKPPEAAQTKESGEGFKYGTGNKPLEVMPDDPEYIKYQAMVRSRIIEEWIIPLKLVEEGAPRLNARLEVMIDTNGYVISIMWDKPSGNASFDASAIRAVKKASPFPKPPDRIAWQAYNEGFLIEFDPSMKE